MATFREEAAEKQAPLLAPIAGASPVGVDVSYDPDFERIKGEIDKLTSMAGGQPAWPDVQRLSAEVLATKSKDLRVLSWMSVAKVKLEGWKGFGEALVAYDAISRAFWDTMYPDAKRARARINVFGWMVDQAAQHLEPLGVTMADGDAVRASDELVTELDRFLAEKLGDAYAGPGSLRSLLREKVRSIPQVAPPPAAAPPPTAVAPAAVSTTSASATTESAAASPQIATSAVAATSVDDVDQAVRANARAILEAAALVRRADPARAWPYRLQRWAVWIAVEDPPPAEDGKTLLRVPPQDERRRVASLRDGEKWLELLNAAEEAAGKYLYWLDAHRYVALAMDKLGPTFAGARETVGREVCAFVSRLPTVADFAFSDGTPFAEAGTKSWLADEAKRWGGASGPSAGAAAASAEDEEVAKRLAEAQQMVSDGKVADGLAVASALASRAADARTRFRGQIAVARMAIEGSKPELARPMLESLLDDIHRHGLEAWEPGLCASVYSLLLVAIRASLRAKNGPPDLAGKEQIVFDKLCRLDPASAIKLSGS
jgi:type VI secretion system protein VasJ